MKQRMGEWWSWHVSHGSTTAVPKTSISTLMNSSRCIIATPSINLLWVAIVCKFFNSLSSSVISIYCLHITCSVMTCTLLCRMKILECKTRNIINIRFIDPDKIHIKTLTDNPKETEKNLLRFLIDQNYCDHILFPYNFKWGSYSVVSIHL
jgi:hypothetical protein